MKKKLIAKFLAFWNCRSPLDPLLRLQLSPAELRLRSGRRTAGAGPLGREGPRLGAPGYRLRVGVLRIK